MQETLINQSCIDFMKTDHFKELVKTTKVIIVTDPPFNIGYHYKSYKDKMKNDDYYKMLKQVFTMYELPIVCIHYPETLYKIAREIDKLPTKVVSWVYNSNTAKQHRDIAFFDIKPNMKQVIQPYKNPNDKRIKERIARGIIGGGVV